MAEVLLYILTIRSVPMLIPTLNVTHLPTTLLPSLPPTTTHTIALNFQFCELSSTTLHEQLNINSYSHSKILSGF